MPALAATNATSGPRDTRVDAEESYRVDFTPDPELFPFQSRWFDSSVGQIHYVDEGEGRPILLMHGNPDWSFLYRKMIPALAAHFRVIAPDYPGFGLSVHPKGYGYLPREHAAVMGELVDHLDLRNAVLVGQDWGGPIGMDVASRAPERFTGLVLGNTFFFPSTFRMQRLFSAAMGTSFMQRQLTQRSLFVRRFMPFLLQASLSPAELAHYDGVAPTPQSRIGHAVFPKAIVGETPWLAELEERVVATLLDRPLLRVMGLKDVPLTTKAVRAKWDSLYPSAVKLDLPNAGHYFQEDDPEAVSSAIVEMYA